MLQIDQLEEHIKRLEGAIEAHPLDVNVRDLREVLKFLVGLREQAVQGRETTTVQTLGDAHAEIASKLHAAIPEVFREDGSIDLLAVAAMPERNKKQKTPPCAGIIETIPPMLEEILNRLNRSPHTLNPVRAIEQASRVLRDIAKDSAPLLGILGVDLEEIANNLDQVSKLHIGSAVEKVVGDEVAKGLEPTTIQKQVVVAVPEALPPEVRDALRPFLEIYATGQVDAATMRGHALRSGSMAMYILPTWFKDYEGGVSKEGFINLLYHLMIEAQTNPEFERQLPSFQVED